MPILMNQMGALTPDKDLASTPDRNGWSKSQEDSGAAMHLMHGVEDFVLGHTDQVHITAGTARHGVEPTKLDIVGPILRGFKGTIKSNVTVNTLQYIGCGATDSKGEWAQAVDVAQRHRTRACRRVRRRAQPRQRDRCFCQHYHVRSISGGRCNGPDDSIQPWIIHKLATTDNNRRD
jgi:hypothetical protein